MSNKRRKGGKPTRPQERSLNRKSKRTPMSGHEAKVMGEVITKPVTIFLRRWITTTLEEAGKTDAIAEVDELVRRHRGWVTATAVLPALEAGRTSTPSIIPEGHIAISVVDLTQRGADGQFLNHDAVVPSFDPEWVRELFEESEEQRLERCADFAMDVTALLLLPGDGPGQGVTNEELYTLLTGAANAILIRDILGDDACARKDALGVLNALERELRLAYLVVVIRVDEVRWSRAVCPVGIAMDDGQTEELIRQLGTHRQ